MGAGVEHGQRQGQAIGVDLFHIRRHDQPSGFLQSFAAGEKRGRVAVIAETQQDQVEAGNVPVRERQMVLQNLFIFESGDLGLIFSRHPMNVFRQHGHLGEKRFPGHAKIALRVIGRNAALVSPEKANLLPGNLFLKLGLRQTGVKTFRCGAARKRDRESTRVVDKLSGEPSEALGGLPA